MDSYRRHSRIVAEIIKERVPVVEKASIDEFNVDLSGMDRLVLWVYVRWGKTSCYQSSGRTILLGKMNPSEK